VHPHIGVAFDRMRTFEQERQRRRLLESFYRVKPEAVLFLDWNLQPIYTSQDALELCAAWNLGPKQARSFTAQAVFAIPAEIAIACDELKICQQLPASTDEDAVLPVRRVVSAHGDFEALVSFRREKGSTLTKPIFVIRLRPGENALVTPNDGSPDFGPGNARLMHQLTPVERELAALVCAGLTNKEIARQLSKTEGSVKVQLSGVFRKLRVKSRTQLIVALR
jgi:DNA-binding CsgD family transcriptional regulator